MADKETYAALRDRYLNGMMTLEEFCKGLCFVTDLIDVPVIIVQKAVAYVSDGFPLEALIVTNGEQPEQPKEVHTTIVGTGKGVVTSVGVGASGFDSWDGVAGIQIHSTYRQYFPDAFGAGVRSGASALTGAIPPKTDT